MSVSTMIAFDRTICHQKGVGEMEELVTEMEELVAEVYLGTYRGQNVNAIH